MPPARCRARVCFFRSFGASYFLLRDPTACAVGWTFFRRFAAAWVRSVEEILRYARCRGLRGCFRCHPELSLD